jgi:molecular chaperone Hsp33
MTNQLFPFLLNEAPVRGRIVRLDEAVTAILNQHQYPQGVAKLLGEALVLVSILSSNLKGEGLVTLQIQGQGPLKLLVADATADGNLRGYVDMTEEALPDPLTPASAFREGYMAITLDAGQRYQGIVELKGESLAEAMDEYFVQSQQLELKSHIAVAAVASESDAPHWRAAGMVIEHMPGSEGVQPDAEIWLEASVLFQTMTDKELLDPSLSLPDLLYRLYHERGVMVYEPHEFRAKCRCGTERILAALEPMADADKLEMLVDGEVKVDCQFCGTQYRFSAEEIGLAAGGSAH